MSENILQRIIFSNTVAAWLITVGIILFMVLFAKGISKLVAWLSMRYLSRVDHHHFKEPMNERLVRPLSRFLFWLIAIISLHRLVFPAVLNFSVFDRHFSDIVHKIAMAWVIYLFFNMLIGIMYMVAAVFKRTATRSGDRSMIQLASLLSDLVKAALVVLCILGYA